TQAPAGGLALAEQEAGGQAGTRDLLVTFQKRNLGEAHTAKLRRDAPLQDTRLAQGMPRCRRPAPFAIGRASVRDQDRQQGRETGTRCHAENLLVLGYEKGSASTSFHEINNEQRKMIREKVCLSFCDSSLSHLVTL